MDIQSVSAFLRIPYGIYILTTDPDFEPQAMVVSWVSQVSYSPPLLMVALRRNRPAIPAILKQGLFALNLLKADRVGLLNQFKKAFPPSKEEGLFVKIRMETGNFYRLKEGLAFWACRVISRFDPGDHNLFIAEVLSSSAAEGRPLITSDCGKTYTGEI